VARTTLKDVAREAAVSQTTASFVLNGRADNIPDHTQERVVEAAKRLGYVPSAIGRALASGRSNVVVCIEPGGPASDIIETLKRELSTSLQDSGYTCVYIQNAGSARPLADVWGHVDPAAVISLGDIPANDLATLSGAGIPTVDGLFTSTDPVVRIIDQGFIGRAQVRFLATRGHTRLGYLTVDDPAATSISSDRLAGAQQECEELGLAPLKVIGVDGSRESATLAVSKWVNGAPAVTAVAAFNDLVALSVIGACRVLDIAVPETLAIVGVDNVPAAPLISPALTTIAFDSKVIAKEIARRTTAAINRVAQLAQPLEMATVIRRESA
jgi:DNA-binding LacI/PurR family transcriptional regulator